jgi:AbiV family abortive infection protein
MDEKLQRAGTLCLEQAESFITAANHLGGGTEWSHIVYHLSLLALEEVGKASMLGARTIGHTSLDGTWIERSLDNHKRKLQWYEPPPLCGDCRLEPAKRAAKISPTEAHPASAAGSTAA